VNTNFDVIIVGSGPAGVSAAFPLLEAGLRVLMVDGGKQPDVLTPEADFLSARSNDTDQWKWMLGEDFHTLKMRDAVSPKLRAPTHHYVFDNFAAKNYIESENFIAIGSLAKGGLSNAWGCGVARLSSEELDEYPFRKEDIERSYETVTRRIGVSGANADDLSDYFGLDAWSQPPIPMDELHQRMIECYSLAKKKGLAVDGFRLGRSRVAVLSRDLDGRKACDLSGNCLWGCHRKSMYSSSDELSFLSKYENFYYQSGLIVKNISKNYSGVSIEGMQGQGCKVFLAKRVILAAGTLATTRLALDALKLDAKVRLQCCPTAAFLLWLPRMLGAQRVNSFGLGQLSFSLKLTDGISAFGSTFSTLGIPVSEFVRHMPLRRRFSVDLLRQLLSSCVVGNMFLPGSLSSTEASLDADGALKIKGGYSNSVNSLMSEATSRLRKSYWKIGALLLPKSFTKAQPGGDIHYSSTLPMRPRPIIGETDANGELVGLSGVHVVDGACLPSLTEKSHTLTIMANADRIGRILAMQMTGKFSK